MLGYRSFSRLGLVGLVVSVCAPLSGAQTSGFGAPQVITAGADGAMSVYATDLDGDGDADVLSASAFDDKIAWYENQGGGVFGEQQVITTAAVDARSVYATDLDGDGDADVLSASSWNDRIAWYENLLPCEVSTYCFSTMNSTGGPARISWAGSGSLSSQDLSLIATDLPPHQFGIFFYGAQEHFGILGDGVLCAKPPLYRIGGAQPSGPDGTVTLPLDYGSHPMSGGPGQVTSSSTWYFQFWFRDPTFGPAGSNTTDGLEVIFCP